MDYKLVVERKELSRSFLVSVFVTFLLCMVAVAVWKYSLDKRGIQWKSHSSYYSSKGRIFAANESKNRIDTVFLGSSITGRIPGVESGNAGWANLGIDASSAREGLELMLKGLLPPAEYVVVEMDRVFADQMFVYKNPEHDLRQNGSWCPLFNPLFRASTLLYTELRNEHFNVQNTEGWALLPMPPVISPLETKWSEKDAALLQQLKAVQEKFGSRLVLVLFPVKSRISPAAMRWKVARFAKELNVPWLDFNAQIPPEEEIRFSDAVHMQSNFAMRAAATIRREAERLYREKNYSNSGHGE